MFPVQGYIVQEDLTEGFEKITPGLFPEDDTEQLPEVIQGKKRGSKEEARVALALDYYDMPYIYHYEFKGGTGLRGGQVVDFLVLTKPLATPVYVQSEYWHSKKQRDLDKMKIYEFQKYNRGEMKPPVELWDYELMTLEMARATVKDKVL